MKPEYSLNELMGFSGIMLAINVGYLVDFFETLDAKISNSEIEKQVIEYVKKSNNHKYLFNSDICLENLKNLNIQNLERCNISIKTLQDIYYEFNLKVAMMPSLRTCKIKTRDLSKYKNFYTPFDRATCDKFVYNKFVYNLKCGVKYENLALSFLQKNFKDLQFRKATKFEDTHNSVDVVAMNGQNIEFGVQVKPFTSVKDNLKWKNNTVLTKRVEFPVYFLYYEKNNFKIRKNGKYFVAVKELENCENLINLFV